MAEIINSHMPHMQKIRCKKSSVIYSAGRRFGVVEKISADSHLTESVTRWIRRADRRVSIRVFAAYFFPAGEPRVISLVERFAVKRKPLWFPMVGKSCSFPDVSPRLLAHLARDDRARVSTNGVAAVACKVS